MSNATMFCNFHFMGSFSIIRKKKKTYSDSTVRKPSFVILTVAMEAHSRTGRSFFTPNTGN